MSNSLYNRRTLTRLQLLVKVAQERQEMLPALVYESRPVRGPYQPGVFRSRAAGDIGAPNDGAAGSGDTVGVDGDEPHGSSTVVSLGYSPHGGHGYVPPDVPLVPVAATQQASPALLTAGSLSPSPARPGTSSATSNSSFEGHVHTVGPCSILLWIMALS
jgi:hypothetical protein